MNNNAAVQCAHPELSFSRHCFKCLYIGLCEAYLGLDQLQPLLHIHPSVRGRRAPPRFQPPRVDGRPATPTQYITIYYNYYYYYYRYYYYHRRYYIIVILIIRNRYRSLLLLLRLLLYCHFYLFIYLLLLLLLLL